MKRLFFLALLFLAVLSYAQEERDVIFLKNQSVIRGEILEKTEAIIKIKTCGDNIFVYQLDEVLKTEKEAVTTQTIFKEKGYYNFTSAGIVFGSAYDQKPNPFSFLMEHNYQLNNHFSFGLLTGVEMLNETIVPIGLNAKGIMPLTTGSQIFFGASGGYSISVEKPVMEYYEIIGAYGGEFVNVELGVMISGNESAGFFAAVGYRYNTLNYTGQLWNDFQTDRKMTFNRLSVRIGITLY